MDHAAATATPKTSRWGSGILHAKDDLFLGALLPFWVFAWAQLLSGSVHRAQGPDGAP